MKVWDFIGANAFIFGMLFAGLCVVIVLVRLAQLAGAGEDVLAWLYWPIGLIGIFASYYAGKHTARLLSKVL